MTSPNLLLVMYASAEANVSPQSNVTMVTVDRLRRTCGRHLDRKPQHRTGRQQDPHLGQRRQDTHDRQREAYF